MLPALVGGGESGSDKSTACVRQTQAGFKYIFGLSLFITLLRITEENVIIFLILYKTCSVFTICQVAYWLSVSVSNFPTKV